MIHADAATSDADSIDDYRLVRPLGRAGSTFLAHDRLLDRAVVVSFLPDEAGARAAVLDVARAFARLAHPNLARVHRVREGGQRPYVVAAFARGRTLDALTPPLPDTRVLDLGRRLAEALADLHAAGVAHGGVVPERVILSEDGTPRLVGLDLARAGADDAARRADVSDLLAVVQRLASHELRARLAPLADRDRGVATAEELRRALEALGRPVLSPEALDENPYRGLRAFEAQHAAVFFGRNREVGELVERLRVQPWLLVAGRSGAGKSSLARAGIAPAIEGGALGEREAWDVATMVPGARPLEALARALAPFVDREPESLHPALGEDPALAGRLARSRTGRGLLLVVDQLEETMTLASAEERGAFCAALERFGTLAPGVRVLFTLRADFLDELLELGAFGRDLVRAAYVLPPMSQEGLRAAIVLPARAHGVELETKAMVAALVEELRPRDEALPLLSFVLAELWSARDVARRVIPEEALKRAGGAVAALARHGDLVLATLAEGERREARRILLDLAMAAETRARRTAEDLLGAGGAPARAALEALVRGRLVVAGEAYEIAHEALGRVWPRLRAWLDEASEARSAAARLAVAAREWVRLGRSAEGLGGARLLRDLEVPGALDGAGDEARAFVEASRAAVRRARRRRFALALGVPVALALLGVTGWGVLHARHRAAIGRAVAAARAANANAEGAARAAEGKRALALAQFEADDLQPAEALWKETLALEEDTDRLRRDVGAALDGALTLDPGNPAARSLYADVTYSRLLAAERLHKSALLQELRARLGLYDDGSRAARLRAPGRVRAVTSPKSATMQLARYREDARGHLVEADPMPFEAERPRELEPGSYLIVAQAPGRYTTRYPFLVRRSEDQTLQIVLPPAERVPEGMIYVPAGRTLYGSGDDEATRGFLTHQPVHDVEVGPFLIGRTEVTIADYLAFLGALPEAGQKARLPRGLTLLEDGRVAWKLRGKTLRPDEPYCNGVEPCVPWTRLPVDGASREDGERFAEWLAQSGGLAGARLCTDREWERAARGADDRRYPNGNGEMGPDDACTLTTYGEDALRGNPCAVGTHPASRSPFGVDDMVGSQWEWSSDPADVAHPTQAQVRGGSWLSSGMFLVISNRGTFGATERFRTNGFRVCADVK